MAVAWLTNLLSRRDIHYWTGTVIAVYTIVVRAQVQNGRLHGGSDGQSNYITPGYVKNSKAS